jgi:PAS domain S-box-containing protein
MDITDRKRAKSALIESDQFNQQIIASAQEGFIVYGPDLRYQVWNPYMEKMTGIPASDVLGLHPLEVFPSLRESGVMAMLEKALEGEISGTIDLPFHFPQTGRSGWATHTRGPLRNAQGEIIGVIGTIRDITGRKLAEEERERLQAQLYQAQKMEAVGHLAGGVAHDFNNILTIINGYCALLQMNMAKDNPDRLMIAEITGAADRAAYLTHSLLAFSRKQVMTFQNIDLNLIVNKVEKMLRRIIGEDIRLQISVGQRPLNVNVDQLQIDQVLLNLATNARDAMPKGGEMNIKAEYGEIVEESLQTQYPVDSGRYAILTVSDSGCGMDEVTQQKIFEPFFTTKESGRGTGLGLSIVYGIVKQHGGYIYVTSETGSGTAFRIYLPLATAAWEPVAENAVQAMPPSGDETILVAEDEEPIRNMIRAILTKYGYEVILAEDGQDAIDKFKANRRKIKLVLMDVIMPKKNGKEASEEIARLKKGVTFLFTSGYTADIIKSRSELDEDVELLMKPVDPNELLRKIRQMLDNAK